MHLALRAAIGAIRDELDSSVTTSALSLRSAERDRTPAGSISGGMRGPAMAARLLRRFVRESGRSRSSTTSQGDHRRLRNASAIDLSQFADSTRIRDGGTEWRRRAIRRSHRLACRAAHRASAGGPIACARRRWSDLASRPPTAGGSARRPRTPLGHVPSRRRLEEPAARTASAFHRAPATATHRQGMVATSSSTALRKRRHARSPVRKRQCGWRRGIDDGIPGLIPGRLTSAILAKRKRPSAGLRP